MLEAPNTAPGATNPDVDEANVSEDIGQCAHCAGPVVRRSKFGHLPAYCENPQCFRRCAVATCDERAKGASYCGPHDHRARRHGDPLGGQKAVEPPTVCTVEGCGKTTGLRRGMCTTHYGRWHKYGDPLALSQMKQFKSDDPNRPTCKVADCDRPYKRLGYCRHHARRNDRYGDPLGTPESYRHRACRVCDAPAPHAEYRDFCSHACYHAERRYGPRPPLSGACRTCGDRIEYLSVGSAGVKRYRQNERCCDCQMRTRKVKPALSAAQLAERDGNDCALCGLPVDLTLNRDDPDGLMMRSADHVIPLARDGLNVPENLQLAHLLCNLRKNDRILPPFRPLVAE